MSSRGLLPEDRWQVSDTGCCRSASATRASPLHADGSCTRQKTWAPRLAEWDVTGDSSMKCSQRWPLPPRDAEHVALRGAAGSLYTNEYFTFWLDPVRAFHRPHGHWRRPLLDQREYGRPRTASVAAKDSIRTSRRVRSRFSKAVERFHQRWHPVRLSGPEECDRRHVRRRPAGNWALANVLAGCRRRAVQRTGKLPPVQPGRRTPSISTTARQPGHGSAD